MRKYILPSLIFLLFGMLACNNSAKVAEQAAVKAADQPINQDSIRRLYADWIKNRRDSMPLRQIVEPGKLYPVDEGPTDTSFYVFREGLWKIIENRDKFQLLEMVDENVQSEFGAPTGVAPFVEKWNLDSRKDSSAIWKTLQTILSQGGTFDKDKQTFAAPYYTATFPNTYDANTVGVITGAGVRVRAATSLTSQILKTISYDILPVTDWQVKQDTVDGAIDHWVKVKLSDKVEGYVFGKFVGSPYDYRAIFTRQPNGAWHLTALVQGD